VTELRAPRNRIVQSEESGHPGFRNHVFTSTPSDLRELGEQIINLSEQPLGSQHEKYVTRLHEPNSLGSLVFRSSTEEDLIGLEQQSAHSRAWRFIAITSKLVIAVLAFIGARSLWG
jgi:hypothetical protein